MPMLTFTFAVQGFCHEHILHMALGTSLCSILFTSISSVIAHNKRGAVLWPVVYRITPGILAGTFAGAWIASQLSTGFLKGFFGLFLFLCCNSDAAGNKTGPDSGNPGNCWNFQRWKYHRHLFPVSWELVGGTMSVPFLVWCNTPVHRAIGTSSAIGFSHCSCRNIRLFSKWPRY